MRIVKRVKGFGGESAGKVNEGEGRQEEGSQLIKGRKSKIRGER